MPAVFVHGNPETSAIWEPLLAVLGRDDVLTLSPPGFGAPVPAGFGATREEYGAWLIGELERIGEPVDLVGHDWGGGHVLHVAIYRPDLLRTWCTDIIGIVNPEYVWHDMAQVWQTPGAGEDAVRGMASAPLEDRTALFAGLGIGEDIARRLAAAADEEMGRCILALYRSAAQPVVGQLADELPKAAQRPGLAIVASEDPYVGGEALARKAAERAHARVEVLSGLGHWWMIQDPETGARVLRDFWAAP